MTATQEAKKFYKQLIWIFSCLFLIVLSNEDLEVTAYDRLNILQMLQDKAGSRKAEQVI